MDQIAPSKSIFFHHVDVYRINLIKKRLIEENIRLGYTKYEIYGCMHYKENLFNVMHSRHPVEIVQQTDDNYIQKIINCDIILFNAGIVEFEDVCTDLRRVFGALEEWANEQKKANDSGDKVQLQKQIILISTSLTWALTKPNLITNEEEEENEMNGFLFEEDYRRRRAHPNYCKHKLLERDVIWLQKRCKPYIKSLVFCPGMTYGGRNYVFHYIFKLAFYNKEIPIVRPGSQLIPLIYIKDFVE